MAALPAPSDPAPASEPAPPESSELARLAGAAVQTAGDPTTDRAAAAKSLAALMPALAKSAQQAGVGAVAAGRWVTDVVLDIAPQIPIRNAAALRSHHPGRSDAQIADALIKHSASTTAALGAAAGALAAVEFVAPPSLLAAPIQLAAHLVAVTAVELKLVAELHELAGDRPSGTLVDRTGAYLVSWVQRRAVSTVVGSDGHVAVGPMLTEAAQRQIRSQLLRRLGRSATTMAPLLIGAVAGAEINRRTTKALGSRLVRDLRL
ncbi:MAG: hypothetical protein JWN61_2409 [Pseudonocardiales bacterium]|nr:hypothetical protein [Jatrophihabitantaceae bacterium]MCW2604274.1 hypothetical protein [Pseudonocardiales bacterium]